MAIYDFKCSNTECDYKDEFIISPSVKDDIPEVCPKCEKGKLEKQFPNCKNVGVDVIGGYDYQYGKKSYRKNMSAMEQANLLVPNSDGKYCDPY